MNEFILTKKINSIFLVLVLFNNGLIAQVKIGENPENIEQGSLLELESTNRTLVLTRVSESQMQAINPSIGALVYNTDSNCIFYFDGSIWLNLCSKSSGVELLENGDRTYTFDTGNGVPITFDGAEETITTIIDNSNGSFTYTNESGDEATIMTNESSNFSISDNGDGTFTIDDGVNQPFDFFGGPENLSTISDNGNGTYTYTDEAGTDTTIISGGLTITDNGDDTYTVDDGSNPPFTINGALETTTNVVNNGDSTYTYTNELGVETTISIVPLGSQHFGDKGSVFFANSTTGEPTQDNGQFFWDNDLKRLGIGTSTPGNTLDVNGLIEANRISNSPGDEVYPGYHFETSSNTGIWLPTPGHLALVADGSQVVRVTANQRVGIEQPDPQATLHVGGDLIVDGTITNGAGTSLVSRSFPSSKNIRRVSAAKVSIKETDDTLILEEAVNYLILPNPSNENFGRIIIIKNLGGTTNLSRSYRSLTNIKTSSLGNAAVIWLQCDGAEWQQIN